MIVSSRHSDDTTIQLRMMDKCGGMAGLMGDKSRHRIGRKIEERKRKL